MIRSQNSNLEQKLFDKSLMKVCILLDATEIYCFNLAQANDNENDNENLLPAVIRAQKCVLLGLAKILLRRSHINEKQFRFRGRLLMTK